MANERRYPGDEQPEDEIPEEVECISLEGFEVVKQGDILHIRKKQIEQEEEQWSMDSLGCRSGRAPDLELVFAPIRP